MKKLVGLQRYGTLGPDFEHESLEMVTDQKEIEHIWNIVGMNRADEYPNLLMVQQNDGEYTAVLATYSNRPYDVDAPFYIVTHFFEIEPEKGESYV